MEELLYGAAYDLESLPEDRMDYDFMLMKRAGMNVIRVRQPAWGAVEPEEGVYDFSMLDKVLSAADEVQLQVIVGIGTGPVPLWLKEKEKYLMSTVPVTGGDSKNADALSGGTGGREDRNSAGRNTVFQNPADRDFADRNPVKQAYRFYAEKLIRRIVERTGRHRCVIGYQLEGSLFADTAAEEAIWFRKRLAQENATGAELAGMWNVAAEADLQETSAEAEMEIHLSGGAAFSSSEEGSEASAAESAPENAGAVSADAEIQRTGMSLQEAFSGMAEVVSTCRRPEQFITSLTVYDDGKSAADRLGAAASLVVQGCDSYFPAQENLTGADIAFQGDFTRTSARGNYYVLGTQAQASMWNTPYPGQLRLQAYSHLASGADMVMYSCWHSAHSGPGVYWKGMLSQDMEPNPVYGEARKVGLEWKRIGDKLLHLHKENRAALVVDDASRAAFDHAAPVPGCSYQEIVHWLYDSLFMLNIECDVVELERLDPAAYRMILTPALYCVDELKIFGLRKFVDNGGVLVSTFQSFFTGEKHQVYPDRQPHFMTDVFGMSYQQFTAPGKATVGGQPVENFAELVTAQEAEILAKYQHKYWEGYAAATKNQYGLGKAYYIACMMNEGVLGRILLEAASDAGIVTEAMDFAWPVIVRGGVNREGNRIHYVLHYSEEERDIVCPYEAAELLTGEEFHIGDVLHLKDWDVRILEEKKRVEDQVTFL